MVAPSSEPGGRFVMEGRLLASDSTPLPGITVYAYHVDRKGFYTSKENPRGYPRLTGTLRTDAQGRYRIRSILPGQYGGPPHVHFEAWGPDRPARMWAVNLYMGPNEKSDDAWGHMAILRRLQMDPERTETYVTRDAEGSVGRLSCLA